MRRVDLTLLVAIVTDVGVSAIIVVMPAVDRWGVTPVVVGCGLGIASAYGLAILSASISMLSFAQLLGLFFMAMGFGPLIADISHRFIKRRGIAMALVAGGTCNSGAFRPMMAGALSMKSWQR